MVWSGQMMLRSVSCRSLSSTRRKGKSLRLNLKSGAWLDIVSSVIYQIAILTLSWLGSRVYIVDSLIDLAVSEVPTERGGDPNQDKQINSER